MQLKAPQSSAALWASVFARLLRLSLQAQSNHSLPTQARCLTGQSTGLPPAAGYLHVRRHQTPLLPYLPGNRTSKKFPVELPCSSLSTTEGRKHDPQDVPHSCLSNRTCCRLLRHLRTGKAKVLQVPPLRSGFARSVYFFLLRLSWLTKFATMATRQRWLPCSTPTRSSSSACFQSR